MMTPTLMETARICAAQGGLLIVRQALGIALSSARRDVEVECVEVAESGTAWWDSQAAFSGKGDQEFRELLLESIAFLECFGKLTRHPTKPHWVRFEEAQHVG